MNQQKDKKRKAELQEKYKQKEKPTGVYQVRNNVNGKVLIGSCVDINSMFNRLKFELNTGLQRIPGLLRDWKQYGEDSFSFETLEELKIKKGEFQDVKHELQKLEEKWLERIQPYDEKGYNRRPNVAV
jgi:hypothetical protein